MNYKEFAGKIKTKYPQYNDMDDMTLAKKMVAKYPQYSDVTFSPDPMTSKTPYSDIFHNPNRGVGGKIWDAMAVPEATAKKVLGGLASKIPEGQITGHMSGDIARGTPRILANTIAEAAPGFVSRGSILTAGALPVLRGAGKAAAAIGPGAARQLESLSGMKPGLLGKAFKDASLYFARIPQEAREAYQASSQLAQKFSPEVANTARPMALVQKLLKKASSGLLGTDEALAGRQAIDQLWESKAITENFKNMVRRTFDAVAKMEPEIKEADSAFSRGKDAAGLRQLFPQNKYGGTSAFKTAIMAGLHGMGPAGKVAMAALSPATMGLGATTMGVAAKAATPFVENRGLAISIQQLIDALIHSRNQSTNPGTAR